MRQRRKLESGGKQYASTGGAGYVGEGINPIVINNALAKLRNYGNIAKAATIAGLGYVRDKWQGIDDAEKKAGFRYLNNLNQKNQTQALDVIMHSTPGGIVEFSPSFISNVLVPNYMKRLTGKPIDVLYTGSHVNPSHVDNFDIDGIENVIDSLEDDYVDSRPDVQAEFFDNAFADKRTNLNDNYYLGVNKNRDLVNLYLKGDETGFEDVTTNPLYQNGVDYKRYISEYYPGRSIKTYKMANDGEPLYLPEHEIKRLQLNTAIPIRGDSTDDTGNMLRWFKEINGSLYAIDSDIWDFNPKDWQHSSDGANNIVNKVGTPFILKAVRPVRLER